MEKINPNEYFSINENMSSYIDELVQALRKDLPVYGELKRLNLSVKEVKENIARLTDFKNDYNYCKNCPGIDKCDKTIPHLKMIISRDGNFINSSFEPCDKILEKIRIDNQYLYADFPEEWKESSLQTLDISKNRAPIIKTFNDIVTNKARRWIFTYGNSGVGKSFILVTLANTFVKGGLGQVAIINAPRRIKELSDLSRINKEEFASAIVQLSTVPLLILDDFGNEYKSEYVRDTITLPILLERQRNGLPTFFSSQFSISEIQALYSTGDASGKIKGKQIGNLLRNMCEEEFDLNGVSFYR